MRRWLFNWAYLSLACLIWPWFLFKALTTGKYRAGLLQRMGRIPERPGDKRRAERDREIAQAGRQREAGRQMAEQIEQDEYQARQAQHVETHEKCQIERGDELAQSRRPAITGDKRDDRRGDEAEQRRRRQGSGDGEPHGPRQNRQQDDKEPCDCRGGDQV